MLMLVLMRVLLPLVPLVLARRLPALMQVLLPLPARLLTLALALKPLQTRNFYLGD